jgi:serine protease inhibitor
MPKFKMRGRQTIDRASQELSLYNVWAGSNQGETVDFSGINGVSTRTATAEQKAITLGVMIQETRFEIESDRPEAQTGALFSIYDDADRQGVEDRAEYRFDHPFVYGIMHWHTGILLMLGRYVDPKTAMAQPDKIRY